MEKTTKKQTSKNLTIKGEKFAQAMADPSTGSAQEAAIKAGYAPESARIEAARLLTKANIQRRIQERKSELAEYANITQAQVLGATALRAFATIDDAFDEEGRFDIKKARKTGAIHLIKKITRTPNQHGESVAVEFYSNESAQDKLGSYLGMDKMPAPNPTTIHDLVGKLIERLVNEKGFTEEEATNQARKIYPEIISNAVN